MSVQITCVFQGFVTTVALHWTTFAGHMHFQIPLCVKDSRAIFTFELLLSNTLCHMTGCTIVWDLLSTVFAATFPVRIHVRLKLPPSFARFVTLLTGSHTIIMLVCMCFLRCFSEIALKLHTTQGSMATADLFFGNDALCVKCDNISLSKRKYSA